MRLYLVDTWFLIAVIDRFDRHHRQAVQLDERTRDAVFVTHEGVLAEFLTYFSGFGRIQRQTAVQRVRGLRVHPQYNVASFSPLFPAALDLYAQRLDKEYSLIDCMSMTLMRERGITHVLTNDHHFRQEGFTVVSE
ncbi:MAG TPA: PIN domain-containing protein [Thermoanaerobaculia bacterium]